MIDEKYFFDKIRNTKLAPKGITPLMVSTYQAIFKVYEENKLYRYLRQLAYVLATALHESAHTMNPGIREYGRGKGKKYGQPDSITGHAYYGRGLSQLTWKFNYDAMGKKHNIDLVNNPDKALETDVSVYNLMVGMIEGIFTSHKLSKYINATLTDYVNARRTVNGKDQAHLIAGYAKLYGEALRYKDEVYASDNSFDKTAEDLAVTLTDTGDAEKAIKEAVPVIVEIEGEKAEYVA